MSTPIRTPGRSESIDHFRGCATILMVLGNYLIGVGWIPPWLKHAPDIGLTIVDLGAPLFICAAGFTYGLSWQRRSTRDGIAAALQHFLMRYLSLLGVGSIISAGQIILGRGGVEVYWGVLQAIGVAGLLTLPVIRLPTRWRWLVGLGLLGVYQIFLDRYWLSRVLGATHGGLLGSLGWGAMMIMATALAELHRSQPRGHKMFPWVALLVLVVGVGVATIAPVSKNRVSASYVLIGLGTAGLAFALFDWLVEHRQWRLAWFAMWGRNPFLLFGLHYIILALFTLPGAPGWYVAAPPWLVVAQALALLGVLSGVAWWLQIKRVIYSF